MNHKFKISLHAQFTLIVIFITFVILIVNGFLFFNINRMVGQIGDVYDSNISLNELSSTLDLVQNSMTEYLNTKNTDSYLDWTDQAIEAKRGRNIVKYKAYYENASPGPKASSMISRK